MTPRDATSADLPGIVSIYNHAILNSTATFDESTYTVDERRDWFAQFDEDFPCLVDADDQGILGFAYYLPYRPKVAYRFTRESTIYVREDARGRGIGKRLYESLIERAKSADIHSLIGVVADGNPGSEALHRSCGFEVVGREKEVGYKFGEWIDTIHYQILLG